MECGKVIQKLSSKFHTRNPFDLARELGCIVLFTPLSGVRGFHQYIKRTNIIYIDSSLNEREAEFVCAHELGHMLLHKQVNRIFMTNNTFMVTNKYEREANRFAALLLYPAHYLHDEFEGCTTHQIAQALNLPLELVEYVLKQDQSL